MDIVFAADDNYAAYLCVAAKSVEAAHPDTEIRFHVLDAGISEANRAAVAANLRGGGGNIRFIDVNPEDFAGFPLNIRHISITTYARLKLGEYIADCDKVLYLDTDVLVRDGLKPLWDTDLGGNWVGACIDLFVERQEGYKQKIGMADGEYYFNAGVLLINLKKWRRHDIFKMSCEWVEQYKDVMQYQDQDILNGRGVLCEQPFQLYADQLCLYGERVCVPPYRPALPRPYQYGDARRRQPLLRLGKAVAQGLHRLGCGTFHRVGRQPDDRSRRMARQTCRPADKAYASKMAQKAVCQILTQDLLTGQTV